MSNNTIDIFTMIDGEDRDLSVNFDYTPAERGSRDRYGCPLEPDFDEDIDLCYVWDEYGKDIIDELSRKDKENIIEKIYDYRENIDNF